MTITPYVQIANRSVSEVANYIPNQPRRIIGGITIAELVKMEHAPRGVYAIFSSDGACQYIGKAQSRSFSDRIPAHLDPNPDCWLNQLARKLRDTKGITYAEAVSVGLIFEIHLISIPDERRSAIPRIEDSLRHAMKPILNSKRQFPVGVTHQTALREI